MTFTKNEWAILEHRLSAAGALADALTTGKPPEVSETYDQVILREIALSRCAGDTSQFDDALTLAMLKDCCEGPTFFGDIEEAVATGEESRGTVLAYYRAAKSLERKLGVSVCRD